MEKARTDWVKFILDRFIWFIILGVFAFFALKSENFLTPLNSINLLLHASVLGLMTIGQAICLMSGNFDLSAEGTLSLLAVLAAWLMGAAGTGNAVSRFESGSGWEVNPYVTLIFILFLGTGIGWFNGFMITRLRMNNFIVTLAMQLVLRGLSLALCQGRNISGIPDAFRWLGMAKLGPIPVQLIFTGLCFVGFHYFLKNTYFGRQLYAVGGNKDAAQASGIDARNTITTAYMISGFMAALAAWMLVGRVGETTVMLGAGMTLETVAAAVIGGVALSGGLGSIGGAFAGVLLLSVVENGLNLMQVDPNAVKGIRGFIILVALLIEAQKFRYKPKTPRSSTSVQKGVSPQPGD